MGNNVKGQENCFSCPFFSLHRETEKERRATMNISDKIAKEIFNAVDIIVNQKIRDTSYSQTINCQVKERIVGSDMYVVIHQNEEIRAFSMGASYNAGDKVIVLLPDKDSLSPKFILGRTNDRTPTIVPNQNGELSAEVLAEIQRALESVAELTADNVIFPSEKLILQQQMRQIESTVATLLEQSSNFDGALNTEANAVNSLLLDLKAVVDPVLLDMNTQSEVEKTVFNGAFERYFNGEKALRTAIVTQTLNVTAYKVEVISSNGDTFTNGQIETTIRAEVYKGSINITAALPEEAFIWKRIDAFGQEDPSFAARGSSFAIDKSDVTGRATFRCSIDI